MDLTLLKKQIIEALNLEDIDINDIVDDAPLFGPDGLGLDSIDALELIIMIERNYSIKISDPKEAKNIFQSVRTIGEFIDNNAVNSAK